MIHFIFCICFFVVCTAKDKIQSLEKDDVLKPGTDAWFESLSESELRQHWSDDEGYTVSARREQIARFEMEVFVNIKLVGFHHLPFITQAKADLLRYLDNSPITRFQTAHVLHTLTNQSHDLPVRTNFVFGVELAPASLTESLAKAIETYAAQHKIIEGSVHPIDPELIDELLRVDFTRGLPKYTFYVLYLPPLRLGGLSSNYSYLPRTEQVEGLFNIDIPVSCPLSHWVSASSRLAWLDLSAGPIWFGPHSEGEGFVSTEHNMPSLKRVINAGRVSKDVLRARVHEFFASLAAFVHVSTQQLLSPPLHHFPVPWANVTVVDTVFIHDVEDGESDAARTARHNSIWAPALQQLKELTIAGNRVEVRSQHIKLDECEVCAIAFARALRTTSSKVAVHGLRTPIQEYLSSEMLVQSLASFKSGTEIPTFGRRIPVYVFNLGLEEAVLIDRTLQAKTTGGVVVAVQSAGERVALDSQCNSQRLEFDPRTAARPTLAAILQALGVAATDEMWNRHTQEIKTNYLWSIGHTPFTDFSANSALSFVQKDAATRNMVISEISEVLLGLQRILDEFAHFGMEFETALSKQSYATFVRRWNLIRFKLERAQKTASLMDYPKALLYVRSLAHDFEGIKALITNAELTARFGGKVVVSQSRLPRASTWTWFHLVEVPSYLGLTCLCMFALINPHNFVVVWLEDFIIKKKRL